MLKKRVTLKDVAKEAGVGLGTASRVLNNNSSVKEETYKAVIEAMTKLNYEPNAIARSLKTNSTQTLGIIIPNISSPFYPEIVRGIEDISDEHNYNIFLCNTDLDNEKEKKYLNILKEKKVDGIIFISNTISRELADEFRKMDIPIVLIATKYNNDEFHSVNIDNEGGAYRAVDYLCKLGHKNIAMLAGQFDDPNSGIPRIEGYKKALLDNNIDYSENLIYEGNYDYLSGYGNMYSILEKECIPTAVFAASDIMAVGAARAILESGYKIPEDISIVGFDGIESVKYFYPSISTMQQPRYEMGKEGIKLLFKLINGENITEKNILLNCKFIERESCANIRRES